MHVARMTSPYHCLLFWSTGIEEITAAPQLCDTRKFMIRKVRFRGFDRTEYKMIGQ